MTHPRNHTFGVSCLLSGRWLAAAIFAAVLAVVMAASAFAQDKPNPKRQWQDGKWGDTNRTSTLIGSISNETTTGNTTKGSNLAVRRVFQIFVIETEDRWYVASQRLKWRWSKPVPMTVNATARFAVEKDKIYVMGEDEQEYELKIEKKGLKIAK